MNTLAEILRMVEKPKKLKEMERYNVFKNHILDYLKNYDDDQLKDRSYHVVMYACRCAENCWTKRKQGDKKRNAVINVLLEKNIDSKKELEKHIDLVFENKKVKKISLLDKTKIKFFLNKLNDLI